MSDQSINMTAVDCSNFFMNPGMDGEKTGKE
jgi:hypothetical protein